MKLTLKKINAYDKKRKVKAVYKFIFFFFFLFLFFSPSFSSRSFNSCLRFNSSSFSFSNSSELLKCNVYLRERRLKTSNDWISESDLEKKLPRSLFRLKHNSLSLKAPRLSFPEFQHQRIATTRLRDF